MEMIRRLSTIVQVGGDGVGGVSGVVILGLIVLTTDSFIPKLTFFFFFFFF